MNKILLASLALVLASPMQAQWRKSKKNKSKLETPAPEKKKDLSAHTKNCVAYKGLFNLFQDSLNGDLYLRINQDQLDKEYIYFSQVADGANASGYFRGAYRGSKIFKLRRYYDQIEFVLENTNYYYDPSNPLSKVSKANINEPIILSEKILAKDSISFLIKANELFLGESFNQIKPSSGTGSAGAFNLGSVSKERSRIKSVHNYPANTDVMVSVAFTNPYPTNYGDPSVTDARFVNVDIYHNLIAMPENNYKPRRDDPRLGYFMTSQEDMTNLGSKPYHDMIHRWHLEKKNPELALSEPVEPIVWWIENTTPLEFREIIREGVLRWNKVFEKAGFKNAVVVNIQPDTATWDAGDIRYNVLRWTASPYPRFGGYGPSFVNPRTGQILGADVMLEFVYFKNIVNRLERFDRAGLGLLDENAGEFNNMHGCQAGALMQNQMVFGLSAIQAGHLASKDSTELIRQALTRLVLHEVGHTLGLNHNMKASSVYSPAELKDKKRITDGWLSNSIMEYPAINNALNPQDQTLFYDEQCGPYDEWVIEYGYSEALDDEEAEEKRLSKILSRSSEPMLAFGNDADDMRSNGSGIDPRVNIYDLSSDPVAYGAERILLVNQLMKDLKVKFTRQGDNYHNLRVAYFALTGEIAAQLKIMTRPIGGVYVDRAFVGSERVGTKPFQPVPYATQKEAMRQLKLHAFGKAAFNEPTELYYFLQQQRRGFNFGGNNEDPHVHARILSIQADLLDHLLHKNVLTRISDAALYGNEYRLDEYMNDLTKAVIDEDLNTKVSSVRQNLQILYVQDLIEVMESKAQDNLAKAQAFYQLSQIRRLFAGASSPDAATKAHRSYVLHLIVQAFDKQK